MSRRAQRPELEFGSDSFLDVVCNIVGILIILIVVVGVKAQRQPAVVDAVNTVDDKQLDQSMLLAERQAAWQNLQESESEIANRLIALQAERKETQEKIQQSMEEQELIRGQLVAREEMANRLQRQATDLESDRNTVAARVATLQKALDEKGSESLKLGQVLAKLVKNEQALDQKLRTTIVETQQLQEVLEEVQQAAVPKDRLQHRLSPVTKPAENGELHFRVAHGRISQVPLEALLERLKAQVMSRRSTVMRFNQFEGSVGPVGGYNMSYAVEKEGPSTLEALQSGDGRTRVNVSRWTIEPDESLVDETFDEAVRPGSRYRQAIEIAAPDTVVTMWIYQDSFQGFSPLREIAHGLQLRVAARPLPQGTPIVGSPGGSKSAAQ